jgi:carbon starvation protein
MLAIVVVSAVILLIAYFSYGALLARLFRLDAQAETPAVELEDGNDYVPIEPAPLLSQHFSAIAAAGPIVGPILAGAYFGWAPALLWIVVGSIFIGGVHDFAALVLSIRHKARSVAEAVREHMSRRAFVLFLIFIWLALVYIVVAFADITAASFVGVQKLENGNEVTGAGIASSSLMYLILPIAMGLLVRFTPISMGWATLIFLPLVAIAIWGGQYVPFDVAAMVQSVWPQDSPADADRVATRIWAVALLAYCCVASIIPMWLLLQPRGQLGGWFLYAALAGGAVGLMIGGAPIKAPAFSGWSTANGQALFPVLFITIACGACSGFHALIASGTTSKQLRRETDARPIGYGAMLLEAMVAIVSLCCVMTLAPDSDLFQNPKPNFIYALGIGTFLTKLTDTLGIGSFVSMFGNPTTLFVSFALLAFTTFVYDTLDVCTRLGRFVVQELTGWNGVWGKTLGTVITAGAPLFFLLQPPAIVNGKAVPIWQTFWALFGASNQLLAALTLLGITVWIWRTRRARWIWLVTGVPTAWMYVVSVWALVGILIDRIRKDSFWTDPVAWVATLLVALSVLMLVEAIRALVDRDVSPGSKLPERTETPVVQPAAS